MPMPEKTALITDPDTPILIVDDNRQFAGILKRMLEQGLGYQNIQSVESPAEALKLLSEQPHGFKLLFVDYHFPSGQTGGQLLSTLKTSHLLEDKAALLITSEPTIDRLQEAIGAGASGIVAKPFDREELKKQIAKAQRAIAADSADVF
jgi:CheY-like chemotaxis protein